MRYREIIETTTPGERVAKANHRKAEAARTYQKRMRASAACKTAASDRQADARKSYQSALTAANDSIRAALQSSPSKTNEV